MTGKQPTTLTCAVTAQGMRARVEGAADHIQDTVTALKDMAYIAGMMDIADMVSKLETVARADALDGLSGSPKLTHKLDVPTLAYVAKALHTVVAQAVPNTAMMGPLTEEELAATSMPEGVKSN